MLPLCKLCQMSDFAAISEDAQRIFPNQSKGGRWPVGDEHRKVWEIVQTVRALEPVLAQSLPRLLIVGAGMEQTIYYLSNFAEVHATDLYAGGGWSNFAPSDMLTAPQRFTEGPCVPGHIVVQHMDARTLRYSDNWFDAVVCTSSIEHFGEWDDVQRAAAEMARVLKPDGRLIITTEYDVDERVGRFNSNGVVFNREALVTYIVEPSGCEMVEALDLTFTDDDRATAIDLDYILTLERQGAAVPRPLILLRHNGFVFTSASLVMEKRA